MAVFVSYIYIVLCFCIHFAWIVLYVFIGHCKTVQFIQFVIAVFVLYTYIMFLYTSGMNSLI